MDLYEVVTKEDKLLRKKSMEVPTITPNVVRMLDRMLETMPTGVMITPSDLASELKVSHNLSDNDVAFVFSFILLKEHGIITIPPVSMPGASATIRFDLSTSDAFNLDLEDLNKKIVSSFNNLEKLVINEDECREIVFNF